MQTAFAFIVIALAVYLVFKGADVRLVLFGAGLSMASSVGTPWIVLDKFAERMADTKIVGPLCSAMAFAFVLRATGSDREMVRMLIAPISRVSALLLPGGCVVGFVTNAAITSQTGSAAAVGTIIVPLMLAAGYHPIIVGATLVLGCSAGGNLFNPGEADIVNIAKYAKSPVGNVLDHVFAPELLGFAMAVLSFMILSRRYEPKEHIELPDFAPPAEQLQLNYAKAFLPPLPIAMIFASLPKFHLFPPLLKLYKDGLPVPHAMLIATGVAMLVNRKDLNALTRSFFEGAGYAYTNVISLIIASACFVAGMDAVGLTKILIEAIKGSGVAGTIMSGVFPWLLALLSGSGTTPSVAFSQSVLPHIAEPGAAVNLGIVATIAASFGRTMSPVAAVVIFTCTLVNTTPLQIVKRTVTPLACGALVVLAVMLMR